MRRTWLLTVILVQSNWNSRYILHTVASQLCNLILPEVKPMSTKYLGIASIEISSVPFFFSRALKLFFPNYSDPFYVHCLNCLYRQWVPHHTLLFTEERWSSYSSQSFLPKILYLIYSDEPHWNCWFTPHLCYFLCGQILTAKTCKKLAQWHKKLAPQAGHPFVFFLYALHGCISLTG